VNKSSGKNRKKSKGSGGNSHSGAQQSSSNEATQPDPRWANELEKLKQMLSAQTSNS